MTDNRQTTGGGEKDKARCGFIYRVTFIEPPEQTVERDFFFTSLSAIYERFSPEQIGCKVSRLWNIGVSDGNPYTGAKTTVTREPLHTKRQNKARTVCFTPSDDKFTNDERKAVSGAKNGQIGLVSGLSTTVLAV